MIWLACCVIVIIGGFWIAFFVLMSLCAILTWVFPSLANNGSYAEPHPYDTPESDFKRQPGIVYVGDPDSCVSKVGPRPHV